MEPWKIFIQESIPFACLPRGESMWTLLGIPFDSTTTFKPGSRFAPDHIRTVACNIEFYSILTGLLLEEDCFNDLGNLILPPGDTLKSLELIEDAAKGIRSRYPRSLLIFIGGEHLLTYPIIRGLRKEIDSLVVFDAHLDLRDEYLNSKLNHATFLRRIVENLDVNVIHIGSRAYSREELEFLKDGEVTVLNVLEAMKQEEVVKKLDTIGLGRTYISVDIDVIDPSFAPGVGNPESLGLNPLTLLSLLKIIYEKSNKVIGFDIVEVNPLVDVNDVTSILASKIILEISALEKTYNRSI
ncbi:MAG: agmatinase [Thermosphaera sp.]